MEKRRDLFPRLAQGASFFFLAACLSVTYECVQIHDAKAALPDNPLADSALQPAAHDPNTPEAAAEDGFISSVSSFFGGDKKTKEEPSKPTAEIATNLPKPVVPVTEPPKPATVPTTAPDATVVTKVQPLPFDFLKVTKPASLETYEITQRINGTKVNYSLNLNPGWGEQTRDLVDKSFYHVKGLNLFIFAEKPDPMKLVRTDKYQEKYAQQEVDKIAATHPSLIPFEFKEDVRAFRFRHWGKFQFVHNGITKLILYTHAGKNGKYSMVVSSQKDLLSPEMRKIWVSAAETFEVDLDQKPEEEPKPAEGEEAPAPEPAPGK